MKGLILGNTAETAVGEVVNDFALAVGSTLGPNGDYVIISSGTSSKVTKDGATVAKSIDYDDPFKAHIANIIREAAIKTETECGDGTTTTTLLACDYYKLLSKFNSYREHEIIRELTNQVIEKVAESETHDEAAIRAAALISANKDSSIADLVCDIVFENPGVIPDIKLMEGGTNKDLLERVDGHRIMITPAYFTKKFMEDKRDNNIRFVYIDQRLDDANQFVALLEGVGRSLTSGNDNEQLIFIFKGVSEGAMVINAAHHKAALDPIKDRLAVFSANIGGGMSYELLEDMRAITGGKIYRTISEYTVMAEDYWFFNNNQYTFTSKYVHVFNPEGVNESGVNERITLIRSELDTMVGSKLHTAYADVLRKRLASLSNVHYIIQVGSETHSDYLERKDRFDDVITSAVTNTIHGVVPGFNTAFISAMLSIPDLVAVGQKTSKNCEGDEVLLHAFISIFFGQTLRLKNGVDDKINIVNDLSTGKNIEVSNSLTTFGTDLMEAAKSLGIYDPAYTVISALRGGFKTGQILAKTKSVVVSNRFASQMI